MKSIVFVLASAVSLGLFAKTVAFYDFAGTAGETVGKVTDGVGGYDGQGSSHANGSIKYSDDVPGGAGSILMPSAKIVDTPLSENWKSVEFIPNADSNTQGAYITIPDLGKKIAESGAAGAFTVECFVKAAVHRTWRTIYKFSYRVDDTGVESSYYSGTFIGKLCENGNNRLNFQFNTGNPNGVSLTAGRWYHTALVYKPGELKLYLDGACVQTSSLTITNSTTTTALSIGGASTTSECFAGNIAAVRVSDTALNTSEFMRSSRYDAEEHKRQGDICGLWASSGTPGELVDTVPNAIDGADLMTAGAHTASGTAPRYSDDVPADCIWRSSTNHTVIASGIRSVQFFSTVNGGLVGTPNQGAGELVLPDIRSRMTEKGAFTLEYFLKHDQNMTWCASFSMIATNTATFIVSTKDGYNSFGYEWTTGSGKYFSTVDMTKRWHHVAIAWDGVSKKLDYYIDYQLKTNGKTDAEFDPQGASGYFGCRTGSTGNGLNGKIACIRLSPRRLNPEDMMVVAKEAGYDDKTLFHWPFEKAEASNGATIVEAAASPFNEIGFRGIGANANGSQNPTYTNEVHRPDRAYVAQQGTFLATNSLSAYFHGYSSVHSDEWAGSQLYLNATPEMDVRPTSFTLELFARRDLAAGESVGCSSHGQLIASFGNRNVNVNTPSVDFYIALRGDTQAFAFGRNNASGEYGTVQQAGDLSDGKWHHLAWTYDDTTYTYCQYIDYRLVSTFTDTEPLRRTTDSNWTWTFGRGVGYGGFLGWMDDIRVSNGVRPVSEFLRHRKEPEGLLLIFR